MVRILARRSLAKIPMARPNEPDMPLKRTKKIRFTVPKLSPKFSVTVAESGQWLDIVGYQDSRVGFWLANCEFGYGNQAKHNLSKPTYGCNPKLLLFLSEEGKVHICKRIKAELWEIINFLGHNHLWLLFSNSITGELIVLVSLVRFTSFSMTRLVPVHLDMR